MVSLGWEWKRDGKVIGDGEVSRELHLNVFPGGLMDLEASASAPDAPGPYVLEISLAAEIGQSLAALDDSDDRELIHNVRRGSVDGDQYLRRPPITWYLKLALRRR